MPFTYQERVLAVDRVRLSGSQLGLTAKGTLDLANDRIDLSGTIVPIYGLNWAIGRIPILGDFLRGSEGDGAFAMTYSVSGAADDPRILVNPLSVLAPGVIRELFSGILEGTTEARRCAATSNRARPEPPVRVWRSLRDVRLNRLAGGRPRDSLRGTVSNLPTQRSGVRQTGLEVQTRFGPCDWLCRSTCEGGNG